MASFGRNSTSTTYTTIENQLTGSLFTLTEQGALTSITADINITSPAKNGKFIVYRHSDLAFMGETEQLSWAVAHSQRTNKFTVPLILPAGDYILFAWCVSGTGNGQISYATGTTSQGHYKTATYGTAPKPLVTPTHNNYAYNIYATYNPLAILSKKWIVYNCDGLEYTQIDELRGMLVTNLPASLTATYNGKIYAKTYEDAFVATIIGA
jgi:hypothetical protein